MTEPAAGQPETASWWEDYLEIFFAPSRVFARRTKAGFLLPLLILTVLGTVLAVGLKGAIEPALEADIGRRMEAVQEKNPQITAEQMDQGRALQLKIGTAAFIIMFPLLPLVVGLMLWLAGKFVGATETLKQAVLIAAFASFPRLVGVLAVGIQGLVLPVDTLDSMSRLSLGPARFLDPDTVSLVMIGLASRFDLIVIWSTLLLAIGLKVIAKLPLSKALIAAGLVWLVATLPSLASGMGG